MDDVIPVESGHDYRVLDQGIIGFYFEYQSRARHAGYHVFSFLFVRKGNS